MLEARFVHRSIKCALSRIKVLEWTFQHDNNYIHVIIIYIILSPEMVSFHDFPDNDKLKLLIMSSILYKL